MTTPRPIDYQIESRPRRGLPRPTPESRPQTQQASPLQGVAAALGQTAQRVASTLQRAGQTIATGATVARRAGEFAAWTERQSEELFRGKVTPATVAGTAASFVLPTTIMQIAGGQKKADILSILYLRCVVSLNGRGYAVKEITFNSLFEMPSSRRIVAVS